MSPFKCVSEKRIEETKKAGKNGGNSEEAARKKAGEKIKRNGTSKGIGGNSLVQS